MKGGLLKKTKELSGQLKGTSEEEEEEEKEEEEEEEEDLYKNVLMTSLRRLQSISKASLRRLKDVTKTLIKLDDNMECYFKTNKF